MTATFEPRTAPLPDDGWSEPIAPWRVEARPSGYGQTNPVVTLTLFRVTQDGPDAPRIMRTLPVHMSVTEGRELVAALAAAVKHLEAETN